MLYGMFHAQIYIFTCLYVQIYMFQVLCHVFQCFVPLLFQVDVRVTCSHACMMLSAMPYLHLCVTCLCPCHMIRSLFSHAYMLGPMFFLVYVLGSYMFTCMFLCLHVQIYVFTCLCAWIYVPYMSYTIFHVFVHSMPCLCAHVVHILLALNDSIYVCIIHHHFFFFFMSLINN